MQKIVFFSVILSTALCNSFATEISQTSHRALIVESVYPLKIELFKKPIVIERPINQTDTKLDSPENTAIAHFSSLKALDVNWNNRTWDKDSLGDLLKEDH